jgi:hypothetical protein
VSAIAVRLRELDSGRALGEFPLAAHTRERLIADAHACALACGALPNDGAPLDDARLLLEAEAQALVVHLRTGDRSWHKRFSRFSLSDDVEVIAARALARAASAAAADPRSGGAPAGAAELHPGGGAGALARSDPGAGIGSFDFSLAESAPREAAAVGLGLDPLPRALPVLPTLSLRRAGLRELPRCSHPAIFLTRQEAARLLAHARRTPEVEVGALLVGEPFLIEEPVPFRLALRIREAVPLSRGTHAAATEIRITPAALAAVPVDPDAGRHRCGLAHSHCFEEGAAFFLSSDDKAFSTGFFWLPYQCQLVVDPRGLEPATALAAFCWVDARLARVCFHVTDFDPLEGAVR